MAGRCHAYGIFLTSMMWAIDATRLQVSHDPHEIHQCLLVPCLLRLDSNLAGEHSDSIFMDDISLHARIEQAT